MSVAQKIETQETTTTVITGLPCFSLKTLREFAADKKVFGKGGVCIKDVVLHVRSNSTITSYSTIPSQVEEGYQPLNNIILPNHNDQAIVYIESGILAANDEESITRFARTLIDNPDFLVSGRKHSNKLADIIQARETNSPKDLVI